MRECYLHIRKITFIRTLIQEYNDKELGINSKDGNNPVLIVQRLKHKPPYAGCIRQIAIDKFHVQYFMAEQIFGYKEYCRLFKKHTIVCLDSTVSLALKLDIRDTVKSPTIFSYETVVNFLGIALSLGQMLSSF